MARCQRHDRYYELFCERCDEERGVKEAKDAEIVFADERLELRLTAAGRAWLERHGWAGLATEGAAVQLKVWQLVEVFRELEQASRLSDFIEGGSFRHVEGRWR